MTTESVIRWFDAPTAEDSFAFGRGLALQARAGDLIVLTGPLGAGKTVVAKGIGVGLGVLGTVTSPTFVIARVHRPCPEAQGRIPLVHVDAYRLGQTADPLAEIDDLDLDATVESAVTVVEWGEGLVERLAEAYAEIRIEPAPDTEARSIAAVAHGGDWAERLARVALL